GETLRAALALLLSGDPSVLLLDEPTGSLDPSSTALVEGAIRKEARAGRAVLWVTHDPGQAARMGDALYHLEGTSLRGPERDRSRYAPIMQRLEALDAGKENGHAG
ncbi:MAG TPA: phosphate ABC transporter ATP-binding protein, partial [Gammaproteobacteria bacterium]|nr:phosphate ABC transporter ATP-binding protein [Gammaproteobacteria bacterium]